MVFSILGCSNDAWHCWLWKQPHFFAKKTPDGFSPPMVLVKQEGSLEWTFPHLCVSTICFHQFVLRFCSSFDLLPLESSPELHFKPKTSKPVSFSVPEDLSRPLWNRKFSCSGETPYAPTWMGSSIFVVYSCQGTGNLSWVVKHFIQTFLKHVFHPKICLAKDLSILTILKFYQIEFQILKPHVSVVFQNGWPTTYRNVQYFQWLRFQMTSDPKIFLFISFI